MSFTLDASDILAILLDEPGGDYVYAQLADSQISTVNLSEIYATLIDSGMPVEEIEAIIDPLPFRIRSFREPHARQAAQLRPLTKSLGLSFGDRACIAQSIFNGLPILTADRRMAEASALLAIDIRLIR